MITAMQQPWSATIDQLAELDRRQDFAGLGQALQQLPADPPVDQRSAIAHWRGKTALLEGRLEDALSQLTLAAQLDPQRAANHYLLGAALVRQQHWLDARAALTRALQLQPALAAARLELATVLLALGDPQQVLDLLQPLPDTAQGPLRARRAQAAVQAAPNPLKAAQQAAKALGLNSRLPEALLLEWLQGVGGLLMARRWPEARAWLMALITETPASQATANPVPRRIAWLALLTLELVEPSTAELDPWLAELRGLVWLPPSATEHSLCHAWLSSWLRWVVSALEERSVRDHSRSTAVLAVVQEVLPRLRISLPAADGPGLPQHLLATRYQREQQLQQFSEGMVTQPQLLTVVPTPSCLEWSLKRRRQDVETLQQNCQDLLAGYQPMPRHGRPLRRWLLLANPDLPQCVLYRVEQKRQQLEQLQAEVRVLFQEVLEDWAWSEQLLWADALVICRLPATFAVLRTIAAARSAGLPVWYDLDDLVVDPDHGVPSFSSYGGTITPKQHRWLQLDVSLFAAALRACDAAIVSTTSLQQRWNQLQSDQPVQVLANLAPPELRRALQPPRRWGRRPRLVVASGTKAHKQIWMEELAPALVLLLERNPSLQLDLLGHLQLPLLLQPHAGRIRCHPFSDYSTYLGHLAQANIGLVALEPGPYTDAKSAIRWMEFSYLGLASVLSPTRTYTDILQEGVQTRFARGTAQWVQQVERLLANPGETRALAKRAQERAKMLFGPHVGERFWAPLIANGSSASPKPRRRKLLVLNVYFAPESVGGATRVVQDQVKALCAHRGDQWDVTVLCTDSEPWQCDPVQPDAPEQSAQPWLQQQPIPVHVHQWEGARVVRLAMPPRPWREQHDLSLETLCRWWLPQEGFDLIHAHCLQVLGTGPLIVARELGIPYLVTLHDGWWLSPRQFLITARGKQVQVKDPTSHHDMPSLVEPEQLECDRQRRRALEAVLRAASARLAVSQAFADLHGEAGIRDVTVMENRWQPMPSLQRRRRQSSDQPLRCCFIGGLALHKGIHVLHAAVLLARPAAPGLTFTIIDSRMEPGAERKTTWGSTPVRLIPPVAMDEMGSFYAGQDVLLAPSIWPESFGLVTREALSAGLWVVASEIGALADPIRHGENGHRLPAGDAEALAAVLEQLSAHHPHPQPLLTFSDDRVPLEQELDQLYRSLLC